MTKGDRLRFRKSSGSAVGAEGGFQPESTDDPGLPSGRPEGLLAIHTGAEGGEFMIEEG